MNVLNSFSAANMALPVKLIQHAGVLDVGRIAPVHIQWMPTNRCDAACSFCSCADRNKFQALDMRESRQAIETFARLGTRAVTITGGGEPTLYPDIDELIDVFVKNGIDVGLVSNGLSWERWHYPELNAVRWLRMSVSDEYRSADFEHQIEGMAANLRGVDFALSYVVTENINPDMMRRAMAAVNTNGLTHIRFVQDICRDGWPEVDFENILSGLDTSRAIIQPRTVHEPGTRDCLISLVKPVIGADGNIYPCCGVQYAVAGGARTLGESFAMGHMGDAWEIWRHQWPFDGSRCDKCYYGGYNRTLASMRENVQHLNFV